MSNFIPEGVLRRNRALQELLGLCRAVIADGKVTEEETRFFLLWIKENPDMSGISPVNQLVPLMRTIFDDGVVTENEKAELFSFLEQMTGEDGGRVE